MKVVLPAISKGEETSPLARLNQEQGIKRHIAEYLDFPFGKKPKLRREARGTLPRWIDIQRQLLVNEDMGWEDNSQMGYSS